MLYADTQFHIVFAKAIISLIQSGGDTRICEARQPRKEGANLSDIRTIRGFDALKSSPSQKV
jgi:hypothetical protein